jgi:hypothetical protein
MVLEAGLNETLVQGPRLKRGFLRFQPSPHSNIDNVTFSFSSPRCKMILYENTKPLSAQRKKLLVHNTRHTGSRSPESLLVSQIETT